MSTTGLRVIRNQDITWAQLSMVQLVLVLDGIAHASQVNRNMRRIGDQISIGTKDGTRKVQTLLDVERKTRLLESAAHLLCNTHETVTEDAELHRINHNLSVICWLVLIHFVDDIDDDVRGEDLGLRARDDDNGLRAVDDDRWSGDDCARLQCVEAEDFGCLEPAFSEVCVGLYIS